MKILVGYMHPETREQKKTLKLLKDILKYEPSARPTFMRREFVTKGDVDNSDAIISFGGDGTLLGIAHHIKGKKVLLGVNSDPKTKEGFLTRASRANLKTRVKRFLDGDYKLLRLTRLKAQVGKHTLEPTLNEVFFGNEKPYRTSRYVLSAGKKKESQKSSGVIVSTATGSYGWTQSLGGKSLPMESDKMQLHVREPAVGRVHNAKLRAMQLSDRSVVRIKSLDEHNLVISDSVGTPFRIKKGQQVVISRSNDDLFLVDFPFDRGMSG